MNDICSIIKHEIQSCILCVPRDIKSVISDHIKWQNKQKTNKDTKYVICDNMVITNKCVYRAEVFPEEGWQDWRMRSDNVIMNT